MARTYKDIDFIIGINPYTENEMYKIHFKDGSVKEYKNEPKFTEKFYDNHTQFSKQVNGEHVVLYVRFVASWEDAWTENETTEEYYERAKREAFGSMKLSEYIEKCAEGEEVTVFDTDIDTEVYFYNQKTDAWDQAMFLIAEKLEVKEITERGVTVNFSEVIEKNLKNFDGLFIENDTYSIMCDMENILAGCVSEQWLVDFANRLS